LQAKRDKAVTDLLDKVNETYVYIIGYNDIENLDSGRRDLLKKLLDQTIECAYFIRDLDNIKSFCEKVVFLLLQLESFFTQGVVLLRMLSLGRVLTLKLTITKRFSIKSAAR
jgi:hypothetical protein